MRELRVGAAEADITPRDSQYLGGFGLARRSTGVHSPLKARALVLECDGLRLAIVGLDNLGLQREDADWVKSGIGGFAYGNVLLCSSHTHAAPDLIGLWGWYLVTSGRDPEYLALVRRQVAAAVAAAEANARPATLRHGEVRLPPHGMVKNANRAGVFDRRFAVLQAVGSDGTPLGTLLHFACHPEVFGRSNTLVSSDFVGAMCDGWRAAGLGQAVFVNGALGAMVSPDMHPRDATGIAQSGERLVALGKQALAQAAELPVAEIELRRHDLFLPLENRWLGLARTLLDVVRPLHEGCVRTTVGYLRIGTLEAALVPGELEPVFAERIRRACRRPNLLFFGLVDDEVGYLLRGRDARDPEFAYELSMSPGVDAGEQMARSLAR